MCLNTVKNIEIVVGQEFESKASFTTFPIEISNCSCHTRVITCNKNMTPVYVIEAFKLTIVEKPFNESY